MASADRVDALLQQAGALRTAGRVDEAIAAYEAVLALDPALPNSWYNLGLLLRRDRRPDAALAAYAQALAHGIDGPEEVHLNRGVVYADDLRRPDDAERELNAALALNPRYPPALLNLGNLHEDRGRRDAAREIYTRLLALQPAQADALARLAALDPADDALAGRVRALIDAPATRAADRATLGFALGSVLDARGAYDAAFGAYARANRDSRAAAAPGAALYDRAAHERFIAALIRGNGAVAGLQPAAAHRRRPPVFICGMFRSGSTLVEQLLAGHPRVTAGGELDLLPALLRAPVAAPATVAGRYLDAIDRLFPGAGVVTDKRPDNVLHIGSIKAMFPDARIVHTVRDPVDTCLSIYFAHLSHGQPYALDLADIAHHHRQVQVLMAHWKSRYGPDILDLDYDALVRDPRAAMAALLDFCGLERNDGCLDFDKRGNAVRTASVWQVRQPLHARSSGRWRHYQQHLAPLLAALAPGDQTS